MLQNAKELTNEELQAINGGVYYGNGLTCTKHGCSVDWGTAIGTIGNNSAANWLTVGAAGWHSGGIA